MKYITMSLLAVAMTFGASRVLAASSAPTAPPSTGSTDTPPAPNGTPHRDRLAHKLRDRADKMDKKHGMNGPEVGGDKAPGDKPPLPPAAGAGKEGDIPKGVPAGTFDRDAKKTDPSGKAEAMGRACDKKAEARGGLGDKKAEAHARIDEKKADAAKRAQDARGGHGPRG